MSLDGHFYDLTNGSSTWDNNEPLSSSHFGPVLWSKPLSFSDENRLLLRQCACSLGPCWHEFKRGPVSGSDFGLSWSKFSKLELKTGHFPLHFNKADFLLGQCLTYWTWFNQNAWMTNPPKKTSQYPKHWLNPTNMALSFDSTALVGFYNIPPTLAESALSWNQLVVDENFSLLKRETNRGLNTVQKTIITEYYTVGKIRAGRI